MFWIIFSPAGLFFFDVVPSKEFMILDSWFWMMSYIEVSLPFKSIYRSFQYINFLDFHLGPTGHNGMESKVFNSYSLYVNYSESPFKNWTSDDWNCECVLSLGWDWAEAFSHLCQCSQHKTVPALLSGTAQSRAALRSCQIVSAASSRRKGLQNFSQAIW